MSEGKSQPKKKTLTLMVGLGWLLNRNSVLAQTA